MRGVLMKLLGRGKAPMYKQLEAFGEETKSQKYSVDRRTFFRYAAKELKLLPGDLSKEYFKLSRGPGRLTFNDYVLYQLYQAADLSLAEKRRFVSGDLMWRIAINVNDMSWQIVTEDKFLSYAVLRQLRFPIPETLAVVDESGRCYGETAVLQKVSDLGDFLTASDAFPIFAKPNHALGSFGAMIIKGFEDSKLVLESAAPLSLEEGFGALTKGGAFLLQRVVRNHPDIEVLSPHLSTIRLTNFIGKAGVITPCALLKLTSAGSIADNYWRKGNMMADIDMETGRMRRVVTGKGMDMEVLTRHPASGEELIGRQIPYWQEVLDLNERCAHCFAPIKFQSLDVAVTPSGPK
ncbi:MAG TPA: sugar-transfer associated ATP-grasp domain-containing protein, partial [Kiloniellaceae bacterium]|nr:sugar-transfer associated ATP-grasp domain-containing protein [Kiloniellaceae bacterium]